MANTLTELVHGGRYATRYKPVQRMFADERFGRPDGLPHHERAYLAYGMLRTAAGKLGPATALLRDPHRLLAFYEWACVHAPDLLPLISGHYNLTTDSLLTLGGGREDLKPYLDDLDDASSVGVLLINEYACGSNVAFLETTATYDHATRSFVLDTPHPGARKFMPNVGAEIPRVAVVAARLVVDGVQHGVFPFVTRLRDRAGAPAAGATIVPMPDKPFFPMDNAVTSFDGLRVPLQGWLTGGIARIDDEGRFAFAPGSGPHDAFRLASSGFTFGRIALSSAAVAAARASVLVLARYAQTREIKAFRSHQRPMLDFENVRRSLFGSLATVYAATFLANTFKDRLAEAPDQSDPMIQVAGIIAKAHLVTSVHEVVQECRERCGAHTVFSANRVADYLGLFQGLLTAEGDIQVLRLTAGRHLVSSRSYTPPPVSPLALESIGDETAWLSLFRARESYHYERASAGLNGPLGDGTVFDRWNRHIPEAMELVTAHADRLALEAFLAAVAEAPDSWSREALRLTARLYVLDRVSRYAGTHLAEGHLTPKAFGALEAERTAVCQDLTPYLETLVDAFAIDEEILDAPVTSPDRIDAWEARGKDVAHLWSGDGRSSGSK
ncbi:acyl-CoA dehydrogenase [Streptomyces sp. NPDC087226]|uniref:acyl-CoA dehydrogenase n=1 Tax=Streptomyces sp. NPDC087226 TaxID=3365771 RepID=UPI0037F1985F